MLKVIVKDSANNILGEFLAESETSLLEQAEEYGINIPYSCRAGACLSCACHIEQGQDFLDSEGAGKAVVEVNDNEVLTCITTGVQEHVDSKDTHKVVIKII